jgi:hypothetical protein
MIDNTMPYRRFSKSFRESCFVVGWHCYGAKGVWAYHTFAFINAAYFADRLPWPHILWGLTPHGGCVAWASTSPDRSRPPLMNLHPSLLGGTESREPWGISARHLGPAFAFDTLLHESIHIHIEYNLGGHDGRTSHNSPRWIRQVNRLAPLLGFEGVKAGVSKTMRVPDPAAPRTARGKVATRVVRGTVGNIPFAVAAGFPQSYRNYFGTADDYYSRNRLPRGAPQL